MSSDNGIEYVQALSRLLTICASVPAVLTGREAAARDVENRSRRRALALEVDGDSLRIEGDGCIDFEVAGIDALVSALVRHQVGRLSLRQLTPAPELLAVASLLAARPTDPQMGVTIERDASELHLWNVEIVGVASLDAEPVTAVLPQDLVASLRDGADYAIAEAAVAKLATRAEQALEEGDARTVAAVLVAMDSFERETHHDDLRLTCGVATKRLISPMALKLTAQLLPSARRREALLSVLGRLEDEGADALFTHLVAAQSMQERRAFFDALVALRAGVPMLMAALDDEQWYVARNAAELLGEMRVEGAAEALAAMLRSPDERRRIAAASALARLRTNEALSALHRAVNDASPQVRYFAHSALLAKIEGASAQQLGRALEQDADREIKLQIIAALGRLGTPDAVQKLLKALGGNAVSRNDVELTSDVRCASIEAVAAARGRAAMSLISGLRRDRDLRVADTAKRVYERLAG